MSRRGEVTLRWGDGEHLFRLPIAQLQELQDKCDAGPLVIAQRLLQGAWLVEDVRQTLRLGLIGGGMRPTDAATMIERYLDPFPLMESTEAASAVMAAALFGVSDENPTPEKPIGEVETPTPSPTERSDGPASTPGVPPLA